MAYSILIKNGTVIDGTGKEPYQADIAISGSHIVKVGALAGETASQTIDAANLYVAPGFIDLTSHSDTYGSLFKSPLQESLLMQGVTTILVGNCGESLAPMVRPDALKDLERWTTGFSVPINWNSVREYYGALNTLGIGVNLATLIGQETLRRNSKSPGEAAFLLEGAMKEGAAGLSSNFSFRAWGGDLESEMLSLLKVIKKFNGLYKIHLKDEGRDFLPSLTGAVRLARESQARTVISHFKAIGRQAWKDFERALRIIRTARAEGVDISFDVFPYLRTGSMLMSLLPAWAREGSNEEIMRRLENPADAYKIISDLKAATLHPEKILIASALYDKAAVGLTLGELASRTATDPERLILEILKVNKLNVSIFGKTLSGKNLIAALSEEESMVSSDGAGYNILYSASGDLAHPRSFGAFPRYFGKLAAQAGIPLGRAVAKITSLPAKAIGLKNRGLLQKDFIADIVVFHPEEFQDAAVYRSPYRYAAGVKFLIISGQFAVAGGALTTKRLGSTLIP